MSLISYLVLLLLLLFYTINVNELFTNEEQFDIVIPVGPNDINFIPIQLNYTTQNVIGYRNIYLIVSDEIVSDDLLNNIQEKFKNIYVIKEDIFPFRKSDINNGGSRSGWYLQQLLKLYAGFIIPGILTKYLVIDCDTCFLRPTRFIENNIPLYDYDEQNHTPYFTHMQKLHNSLYKKFEYSGISDHMMFDSTYIQQLFQLIEENHSNEPFWKIFINTIDKNEFRASGASEFELYINYMLIYHPDKIKIRKLNKKIGSLQDLDSDLDCVSYHWYLR
jgi:hypothetical protein